MRSEKFLKKRLRNDNGRSGLGRLLPAALLLLVLLTGPVAGARDSGGTSGRLWRDKVVAVYPHDTAAFTEGLTVYKGWMYESTGLYGHSSIRRVDITTGRIEQVRFLGRDYFGEGITVLGGLLYQLTWQSDTLFVYDPATLKLLKTRSLKGEAWGLTDDGRNLIMSDGSDTIRFLDPGTLKTVRRIRVRDGARSVTRLNELEYVRGEIWANIWYQDRIVRISPADGTVLGWIDLSGLYPASKRDREDVLNGIAFDAASGRLYVTGKDWPRLYEIKVVPSLPAGSRGGASPNR